jgi:hypothetical protein
MIILEDSLMMMLEPGEQCKTDKGYCGSAPEFVRCPGGIYYDLRTHAIGARVRFRQRTVNTQLKNWALTMTLYCHNLRLHQRAFFPVITLLQLSFKHNSLFSVDYV